MTSETIAAQDAARRLRALLSGGVGPGLPRRRRDQWILLHAAALEVLPAGGRELDEPAINARLKAWLESLGPRVELDHVSVRRALVDEGFVERATDGAVYRPSRAHERQVTFEEPR